MRELTILVLALIPFIGFCQQKSMIEINKKEELFYTEDDFKIFYNVHGYLPEEPKSSTQPKKETYTIIPYSEDDFKIYYDVTGRLFDEELSKAPAEKVAECLYYQSIIIPTSKTLTHRISGNW